MTMYGTDADQLVVHAHLERTAYIKPEDLPVSVAVQAEIDALPDKAQELSNKTLGAGTKESVSTGSMINITDASDPFQHIELTESVTATIDLSVGVSRSLWVNPGVYTITWPASVVFPGGADLVADQWNLIELVRTPNASGAMYAAGIAFVVEVAP